MEVGSPALKEEMNQSEKVEYYFMEENKCKHPIPFSTIDDSEYLSSGKVLGYRCLSTIAYDKISLYAGFGKQYTILAGSQLISTIDIERPNSIISIMFQTTEYDIMFGFYKAVDMTTF